MLVTVHAAGHPGSSGRRLYPPWSSAGRSASISVARVVEEPVMSDRARPFAAVAAALRPRRLSPHDARLAGRLRPFEPRTSLALDEAAGRAVGLLAEAKSTC
jgi:hypothetical protein